MGKNILIIAGSPRVKSSSNVFADAFAEGAKKNLHTVTKIQLAKLHIEGCNGCDTCGEDRLCAREDDMGQIFKAFSKADLVVFCTPVYYFQFPAQVKAVIDRFYAVGRATGFKYPRKDCMLIAVCADKGTASAQPLVDYYKFLMEKHFKWTNLGVIIASGISEPAQAVVSKSFQEVEDMGAGYN